MPLCKNIVLPFLKGKKKEKKEEKTGEGNLLGMGFCSVENCQLGFFLQEPSASTEFS